MGKFYKILILLLALSLLGGCGIIDNILPTPSPSPSESGEPSPSDGQPSEKPAVSLPPISAWTPPKESYARYYAARMTKFVAQDDYGAAYPYIGEITFDASGNIASYIYGATDKSGRILVDPVYNDFAPIREMDENGNPVGAIKAWSFTYYGASGRSYTTLAALDGSWATADTYAQALGASAGTICVYSGGYGLISAATGALILPFDSDCPIIFQNGLSFVGTESTGYHYIKPDGSRAFSGDYERAAAFSGGLAAVRTNGKWGYINPSGSAALYPKYLEAGSFYGGLAAVRADSGWGIINTYGEYRLMPENDRIDYDEIAGAFLVTPAGSGSSYYYFSDGSTVPGTVNGKSITFLGGGFFSYPDANALVIADPDGHQFSVSSSSGAVWLTSNRLLIYSRGDAGEMLFSIADINGNYYVKDSVGEPVSVADGIIIYRGADGGGWGGCDYLGKTLLPAKYDYIAPANGLYLVVLDQIGSLIKPDGTEIIRLSLAGFYPD